jgi:hypothetical protein
MRQGSWPYPASINADAVASFADALASIASAFDRVDDGLDGVASAARASWSGVAAVTFGHHMNDRGHAFELAATRLRDAIEAVRSLVDRLRASQRDYARAVSAEEVARSREDQVGLDEAIRAEGEAAGRAMVASLACSERMAELAALLDGYANRSFRTVGERENLRPVESTLTGKDLVLDSLMATTEDRTAPDSIKVRRLSDGSYVVVLPGVTDLTSSITSLQFGNLVTGSPTDTVRQIANAQPTVINGGPNPYADAVKLALQRAGVPAGADVTFVGHSYGSYTAVDLAADDAFNSIDGDSQGYNVRVRNVFGYGADVDWKVDRVPSATNVVAMNNRNDAVYQAETRFHPEVHEVIDRATPDLLPPDPLPRPIFQRPVVSSPSDRPNQLEFEINAGREYSGNDFGSGHYQGNYAWGMRHSGERIDRIYNGIGGATVVEEFDVRVPNAPRDVVPPPTSPGR